MADPQSILHFWFSPRVEPNWFVPSEALDAEIRQRFLSLYEDAAAGALDGWAETPQGLLALVIVLDQFPRNMFRGQARAFAADSTALRMAARGVDSGMDRALSKVERRFLYLPFMHSESLADQTRCVALYEALGDELSIDYARRHHSIIARFGRFPHRNAALSRITTPLEAAFLQTPGSSF